LENLGSILISESLVCLCHSDAEGHHPFPESPGHSLQSARRGLMADHPDGLPGLGFLFGSRSVGAPSKSSASPTTGSAEGQTVHGSVCGPGQVLKPHLLVFSLVLCALGPIAGLLMTL
jgi:hypothetical protein